MSKNPAVLFYTSDFLTGTILMTMQERGEYIYLLCLQHQTGHLTADDINSITSSPKVKSKFIQASDGKFHNVRMHEEIEKRNNFLKKQSENVKKRWCRDTVVLPRNIPKGIPRDNENDNSINMDMDTNTNQDVKYKDNVYINNNIPPTTPLGYFYQKYKETTGEDCFKNRKDKEIFIELGSIEPAKLIQLIDKFFSSTDDFIKKAGFTPGVFKSQINKLLSYKPEPKRKIEKPKEIIIQPDTPESIKAREDFFRLSKDLADKKDIKQRS